MIATLVSSFYLSMSLVDDDDLYIIILSVILSILIVRFISCKYNFFKVIVISL